MIKANEAQAQAQDPVAEVKVDTAQDIRSAIFAAKPKSTLVTLFGKQVELKQPTMGKMFAAQKAVDTAHASAQMLIEYAHVPGTDTKVFDPADVEAVVNLPWGKDLVDMQEAIGKLTGIDLKAVQAAVGNLNGTQEE